MRLFGSERMMTMFNALGVPDNEQIEHKALSGAIEKAQEKIESNNFGIRKNLLQYDQVMNEQREIIYKERKRVLDGENMRDSVVKMITDIVEETVDANSPDQSDEGTWNRIELNETLLHIMPLSPITESELEGQNAGVVKQNLKEEAYKAYEAKEMQYPEIEQAREIERVILLKVIDNKWMSHIDDMEQLRQGIGMQSFANRDPLVEYRMAGYDMFDEMSRAIQKDTVKLLFNVRIEQKVEREEVAKVTGTNKDDSLAKAPVRRENKKVYPNDPCPCGSGKKYKQCCGRK